MPCIDTVQGFYFCPATIQPNTSVYSTLCIIHAIIPPKRQNRLHGFTAAFPLICAIPAHTIQQPHKPPIRTCTPLDGTPSSATPAPIPDTTAAPVAVQVNAAPPPIIIRYIRVRPVIDPCPAVQHGADHASGSGSAHPVQGSARRLEIWHRVNLAPSTRCGSPAARVRWAARNH